MLRVRGVYKASQLRQRMQALRLVLVELVFRFELYNTTNPETAIFGLEERWLYPLDAFDGLSAAGIRNLVVNTGYVPDIELPPEAPPGSEPPPNPPPMSERKAAFAEFIRQARSVLDIEPEEV